MKSLMRKMAASKRSAPSSQENMKSKYFETSSVGSNEQIELQKDKASKRVRIIPEYEEKSFKTVHYEVHNESKVLSMPVNWELIYENIKTMRANRDAPVDQMGAEKCCEEDTPLPIRRFHTLVGLMLSSQTKDAVTYAAVMRLKKHGLTVENILNTSKKDLENLIYPAGFYKKKAMYLLKVCQILKDKHDCDIPSDLKGLCNLPGVGFKMAYLCMDIAWDKMEGIGVDTHVHRISNRLGWTRKKTNTPEETRKALEEWLPREYWREVNLVLVGFGQQICLPVRPKCSECLNINICPYGSNPSNRSPKKTPVKKST